MFKRNKENEKLRNHLKDQLQHINRRIDDLTNSRSDKTDDGYIELVDDTREQLKEFDMRLIYLLQCEDRPIDASVYSDLGKMGLASFCASITKTFQTPSIAKMFAKNELNALREKCKQIKNDIRLCKLNLMEGKRQKLEVLCALKCLGCELTNEDKMFIRSEIRNIHSCAPM